MGISNTIALLAPLADYPALIEATFRRLRVRSHRTAFSIDRVDARGEHHEVPWPDKPAARAALFAEALRSTDELAVGAAYETSRGWDFGVTVWVRGEQYGMGAPWRESGALTVTFSVSDLADEYLQERYGHPRPPPGTAGQAYENAEELFGTLCGALESGSDVPRPVHAAMYQESGMRAPATCAMVYHREVRELVRDVRRTWLDRHRGASPLQMWWHDDETPWTARKPDDPYDPIFYGGRRGNPEHTACLAWVDVLGERDVDLAEALDDGEIAARLRALEPEHPHIRFLDFGADGVALVAPPLDTLCRAFRALTRPAP